MGGKIKEPVLEEEIMILNNPNLAVNVNTENDLKLAEKLLRRGS